MIFRNSHKETGSLLMAITFTVVIRSFQISAENYLNFVNAALANRNYAALDSLAVESE